jgi:hypothetical protein
VVCSWSDNGAIYCLQKRSTPRVDRDPDGDFLATRHPNYYGVSRGIWNFSPNIFCKVKSWIEGLTTEATTIRWINKNIPSVPTEEIIYDWVDPEWNRTVMISKRVPGKTYQDAWPGLTTQQRLLVADQVAIHLKALSEKTSDYIQTVQGTGLVGEWSLRVREALPLWKPRIEPRVHRDDYEAFIKRRDDHLGIGIVAPGVGEPFVLQHVDCNPTNFLVTTPSDPDQMPKVTGIIDWEAVGYLPKWQIATRPREYRGYMVGTEPPSIEGTDWQWMLSNACVQAGFPLELKYVKEKARRTLRHYPGIPIEGIIECRYLPT